MSRSKEAELQHRCRKPPGPRPPVRWWALLALLLVLVVHPLPPVRADFYARLPKLGPIRGALAPGSDQQQAVAGFLNIGYAAPPTGPLRLMPPGAAQVGQGGQVKPAWLLQPGGRRSPVRGHAHFGPRCVHLADWLEEQPNKLTDSNNETQTNHQRTNDEHRESEVGRRQQRRGSQSEDCLNLNVFVPIDDSELLKQVNRQQQIKSNYTSQRRRQWEAGGGNSTAPALVESRAGEAGPIRSIHTGGNGVPWTNRSDKRNQDNHERDSGDSALSDQEPVSSQLSEGSLWPVTTSNPTSRRAVLVLLHGFNTSHQANTFRHLKLVRRTQCILITFNYRLGLLGFLPYLDRSADGKSALPRNNYAIWDHIGLLHWIKHNVAAFNGNPNNVTLMAADNQASVFVQLLVMSPLTKGLFNRAIIVHDENRPQEVVLNLDQLLRMAGKARDLRRLLAATLDQIIQTLSATNSTGATQQSEERSAFEYIQSAPLEKLALLDRELRRLTEHSNEQLLNLAFGPNLDDKLLFPHLGSLIRAGQLDFGQRSLANLTQVRAEANYCLYVSRLYANGYDPLGLIGSDLNERGSMSSKINQLASSDNLKTQIAEISSRMSASGGWHRDIDRSKAAISSNRASVYKRSVLATQFNHLQHIHLLNTLLNTFNREEDQNNSDNQIASREVNLVARDHVGRLKSIEDAEEDEDAVTRQQDISVLVGGEIGSPPTRVESKKRSLTANMSDWIEGNSMDIQKTGEISKRSLLDRFGEDRNQLVAQLGSIDLMVGYFKSNASPSLDLGAILPYHTGVDYKNIANALIEATGFNEHLLTLLKFTELHFIASMSADDTIRHYCDFFRVNTTKTLRKSSYVFLVDNIAPQNNQSSEDWLSKSVDHMDIVADGVIDFIRFGDPNMARSKGTSSISRPGFDAYWPTFEPLNHRLKRFSMVTEQNLTQHIKTADSTNALRNQIEVHLDVLPYLNSLDWSQQTNQAGSHSSERIDLLACLSEIDSAINRTRSSKGHQRLFSTHLDDLAWRCLISSALRIRSHLRQYAADDLEHLNRLVRQQLINSSHSQPASSITTRNLVDDGIPIVDALDSQRQQSIQSESGQSSSPTYGPTSVVSQIPVTNGGITGFFAGAYKDAIGKALTIVVGTGLSIFLLNLLVILTITWRSARARRRAEQTRVHDTAATEGVFSQPIKSTLKKKLQHSCSENGFINGSVDGLQMDSLIQSSRSNSEHRAKQLKFDLPNMTNNVAGQDSGFYTCLANRNHHHTDHSHQQSCGDELAMSSFADAHDLNHEHQVCLGEQTSGELGCGQAEISNGIASAGGAEVVLNVEPLLESYYGNLEQGDINVGQNPYELQANGSSLNWDQTGEEPSPPYQISQCPGAQSKHHHHHHYCGLSASPITNQSFSTNTTTTTSTYEGADRLVQQQHHHRATNHRPLNQRAAIPSGKSQLHRQQHALYLDHSTASPSSSTTLSMTPIQLESIAAMTSNKSNNGQYKLEPIGLIYQASELSQMSSFDPAKLHLSSPMQQQEDFLTDKMFLISSPDSALPISEQQVAHSCTQEHESHRC